MPGMGTLVRMMLEGGGFRVVDLGDHVSPALLTATVGRTKTVIRTGRTEELRARFIAGGAPVRQDFADRIGADGYAPDVAQAVKAARKLLDI